ncbi:hypothetical protein Kpol_530p46 [Vanderwaltozyma polyspora DSM 70294]|uniref:RRM domain-containing protein n=1 Tax=Vanderwaltozyma polyspora (strain ATCC 22028 / DSM 70294 / BCRC 21397 / CBS 2163 / NBRC 10782 / NRRL Y-8283 / UCD 57-17) TaxID=436907 RepID=A7TL20_VANPO|nr:uncharacterized protein Kpol_530p46 [Vanderwaltozyma polyspora DSM 70294]EDO17076.1 hypothetical protein Kpol_530p46 [Vanderwaltozyma polyspora DSM 70294]
MSDGNSTIPLPPSSTIETSSEPPRTLWMGDLDPSFDESTIQQIWKSLDRLVTVKLIRAKKNLLIPCSSTINDSFSNSSNSLSPTNSSTRLSSAGSSASPTTVSSSSAENKSNSITNNLSTDQTEDASITSNLDDDTNGGNQNLHKININGVSFIDPSTVQLHHAGYCFVEFQNQEDAQYALSLNSNPIPNILSDSNNLYTNPTGKRNFRLNWASGATLQSSIPVTPEFSLFVGDLSPTATEADLLSLFQQQYRSVKTVRVMTDPITGASRCFGFIRFGDQDERKRALSEMNGVWCQGRPLRVAYATPRNNNNIISNQQNTATQLSHHGNSYHNNSHNNGNNRSRKNSSSILNYQNNYTANTNHGQPPQLSKSNSQNELVSTVFIGGLSPKINESQVRSLFKPFGNIVNVKLPPGKNCGFVKFENRIDAEAAIQGLQGFIVAGNPIRLSWGKASSMTSGNASNNHNVNGNIDQLNNQNNVNYHVKSKPHFQYPMAKSVPQQQYVLSNQQYPQDGSFPSNNYRHNLQQNQQIQQEYWRNSNGFAQQTQKQPPLLQQQLLQQSLHYQNNPSALNQVSYMYDPSMNMNYSS